MASIKNTIINDTGYLRLPVGSTAQRVSGVAGDMRYNNQSNYPEYYNGSSWVRIGAFNATATVSATVTGGNNVYTFTSPGSFTVTAGATNVQLLVVAGGGSGGSGTGGGGGAGGVIYNSAYPMQFGTYPVTVGAGAPFRPGGVAVGAGGNPSVFGPQTAIAGGYGANTGPSNQNPATSGGSGGGGASYPGSPVNYSSGAGGTPGQGNSGGSSAGYGGGGGGGYGGSGQPGNGGFGGPGGTFSVSGSAQSYAGGGSGSTSPNIAAPGSGGGGQALAQGGPGNNATYYGGGGGGGWDYGNAGAGAGYQGIVIVSYPTNA